MTIDDEIVEGSLSLHDELDEAFAQAVARGQAKLEAFREVYPAADDGVTEDTSSVRSRAHRQAAKFAQRIQFLRAERAAQFDDAPEQLDERAVGSLMDEAVAALRTCLIAAEAAHAPASELSGIRSQIVVVAGYSERLNVQRDNHPIEPLGKVSSLLADGLARLQLCACGDRP